MYKTQLIPKTAKGRRPQLKMTPEYITIHSTGNPRSTAQNEADNVCNNNPDMQVSFHWVKARSAKYAVMGDGGGLGAINTPDIKINVRTAQGVISQGVAI